LCLTLVIDPIELAIQDKQSQSNNTSPFTQSIPQNVLQASSEIVDAELIEAVSNDSNVTHSLMLGGSFTILVVEDSIVQRQNIVRSFAKAGYQIIQAGNGREALAQLKQHNDISAIVCDIEMPHMNGFEFLSYRRQDYHLAQIPTIMLTSRGGQKHRQFALALGANGYITKPYADRELLEMVVELSQKVVSS
jgi:two-component system, chemotaxis family, sensor histidine kinase and response regulator PixL